MSTRFLPVDHPGPHTGNDPILALYSNYFASTRVLHARPHATRARFEVAPDTGRDDMWSEFHTYLSLWLAMLFVVADGFRHLGIEDAEIDSLIRAQMAKLRKSWRHTMHYHGNQERKLGQAAFIGSGPAALNDAEDLNAAFERFFKDYARKAAKASPLPAPAEQMH